MDHAITRDLARFFALGVDNETVTPHRPGRVRSGLVYDGFVDAAGAERFNVTSAHCRPGKLHAGCIAQASTFSTTARAWGLDVERAAKRARPDFDGLV